MNRVSQNTSSFKLQKLRQKNQYLQNELQCKLMEMGSKNVQREQRKSIIGKSIEQNTQDKVSKSHGSAECPNCKKQASINQKNIKKINKQLQTLKSKNIQFKQQSQFLIQNFKYILQLVSQNLIKGLKQRYKKLLSQKEIIITKQMKIIQRLEGQADQLRIRLDQEVERREELEVRVGLVEGENGRLRALARRLEIQLQLKSPQSLQTKQPSEHPSASSPPRYHQLNPPRNQYTIPSLQSSKSSNETENASSGNNVTSDDKSKFRHCFGVKKIKTLDVLAEELTDGGDVYIGNSGSSRKIVNKESKEKNQSMNYQDQQ